MRNVTARLEDLPRLALTNDDAYLKVTVELDEYVTNLTDRVRELLPNAVDVTPPILPQPARDDPPPDPRRGLQPDELFARFYRTKRGIDAPDDLIKLFNQLLDKAGRASA